MDKNNILDKFDLYNKDLKYEFAQKNYSKNTIPTLLHIFQKSSKLEYVLNKDIYEFSREELDSLFLNFNCKTKQSIASKISVIKKYIDFCIYIKKFIQINLLNIFYGEEYYDKYINKIAIENQIITKPQLERMIEICANAQDAVIIKLRYEGLTIEEMINLKFKDCKKNPIILRNDNGEFIREFKVEDSTLELIKDAFNQREYLKSNGECGITIRCPILRLKDTEYVLKPNRGSKENTIGEKLIAQRAKRIFELMDYKFLTLTNLANSGQVCMALDIKEELGKEELNTDDYMKIRKRFGLKTSPTNYYGTKRILKDYI